MDKICTTFKFKDDKVASPETYLGARLQKKIINGKSCWTMSSVDYVNAAVTNAEEKLKKEGKPLPLKAVTPTNSTIAVKLDTPAELEPDGIQYFQQLIGIL